MQGEKQAAKRRSSQPRLKVLKVPFSSFSLPIHKLLIIYFCLGISYFGSYHQTAHFHDHNGGMST